MQVELGRRGIVVATAVAVSIFSFIPAAVAGTNGQYSSTSGSTAKFFHSGDYLEVCDTGGDGWSVYAKYFYNGMSTERSTGQWNGGATTCHNFSTGNPAEGLTVSYRAWLQVEYAPDKFGTQAAGIA